MSRTVNEREIVLRILLKEEEKGTYSHLLVREELGRLSDIPTVQRSFIKRLAEGTIERRIEMDAVINRLSTTPVRKMDRVVLCILRMSIYQIMYMDAVPDSAACNEGVKLAKRHGRTKLSGFVNGILRNVVREKESGALAEHMRRQPMSVRYSMPQWIVSMWKQQFGAARTESLLKAFQQIRPVCIRIDERLSGQEREKLTASLIQSGVTVRPGHFLDYCLELKGTSSLTRLPGYREGMWSVQDESSMLVAEAAGLHDGDVVYDVCAAPGGKTMHCASKLAVLGASGHVYADDLTASKTKQIAENVRRMKLTNVSVNVRDARMPAGDRKEKADVLLCDVPCSGLGVMGRKRDIKYNVTKTALSQLQRLQRQIAKASVDILKPGGVLIYSTCTISRGENEENADYIERELGLSADDLAPYLPESVKGINGNRVQLLPDVHGTDGFFLARFKKPYDADGAQ